ncbi:MAG: class I SAM-dependent methyltransferase [Armatimonadetes bacterium]|nr:class I SAM-dependent methyltransferase [Anaerolineae bacterium]
MPFVAIIVIISAAIAVAALAWWLLVTTEGVYLGQRVVIWLYDVYAWRYDRIKSFKPEYEYYFLARPILGELDPQTDPLVLDVATGTGRLPLALCQHEAFAGQIIATDLSRAMLARAAHNLAPYAGRVTLARCAAEQLPFPDNSFDMVACLEALEFTPQPLVTLRECIRVLRPGGLLLITNRINMRMPGRIWTQAELLALLEANGVMIAQAEPWLTDYHKVWGLKDGSSAPIGTASYQHPR